MTGAASEYRYVDTVPGELLDGQPIGPGEYVKLLEEDLEVPHIAAMLDAGKLIPADGQSEPDATDPARKLARKEHVALSEVTPTGANGQITVGDVERHVAEQKEESK